MKNIQILFLFLLFTSISSLKAQSIIGTWVNQGYGIGLLLEEKGAYKLSFGNRTEEGTYTFKEKILSLSSQGGTSNQYQVQSLDARSLYLFDHEAQESVPFTRVPTVPKHAFEGEELAKKDTAILNTGHLKVYTDLLEFLLNQGLTEEEFKAIKEECIQRFNENPKELEEEVQQLHQTMQTVYPIQNLEKLGVLRLMLIGEFYNHLSLNNTSAYALTFQKHCKIVAFDKINRIPLTQKDLDGTINYLEFMSVEFANSQKLSRMERNYLAQAIIGNFNYLSLEQKQSVGMGSLLNLILRNNWAALNKEQQEQLKSQLKSQNSNKQGYWTENNTQSDHSSNWKSNPELERLKEKAKNGSLSESELIDYNAQMDTQNMYFNMMNNMQLQNHATSLNIIENIGGSGNYWEIKSY